MARRVVNLVRWIPKASFSADPAGPGRQWIQCSPTIGLHTQVNLTGMGSYQFTLDNGSISQEERQQYEDNGFLLIKDSVSKDKLAKYRERFEQICSGELKVRSLVVMKDVALAKNRMAEQVVSRIQNLWNDEVLFEYCQLPEVVKYVTAFTGPNAMIMHTMIVNKPPDTGTKSSRHPMHQDLHYFPFRPANRIVGVWTAMEKIHRDNGCLAVIPGSHKGELLEHDYPDWGGAVNKMYHAIKGYDPSRERMWVEMDEGDTLFFHPLLIHGSGTNRTKGFRKAISSHYAASECEYIDVTGTTQQNIADETLAIMEKAIGKEARDRTDYKDVWKGRARVLTGKRINI